MEFDTVLKHPVMILAAVFWMMFHGFVIHSGISEFLLMGTHADAAYMIVRTINALYNRLAVCDVIPLSLASARIALIPLFVTLPTCSLKRSS
jgi:hypothetical protein